MYAEYWLPTQTDHPYGMRNTSRLAMPGENRKTVLPSFSESDVPNSTKGVSVHATPGPGCCRRIDTGRPNSNAVV